MKIPDINELNSEEILSATITANNFGYALMIMNDLNHIDHLNKHSPMAFMIVPQQRNRLYDNIIEHVEAGIC